MGNDMTAENGARGSSNSSRTATRRGFLLASSAVGSLAVGSGVVGAVTSSEDELKEQELRRHWRIARESDADSTETFFEKLENAGFNPLGSQTHTYSISNEGKTAQETTGDEPTPEPNIFEKGALTVTVTLTEGRYSNVGGFDWAVDLGLGNGEGPKDNLTLSWPTSQHLFDNQLSTDNMSVRERDAGGIVWAFGDGRNLGAPYTSASGYGSVGLNKEPECGRRYLYGTYEHTWEGVEVTGISIGASGAVAISYSDVTKRWKVFPQDSFNGACQY